MRVLSAFFADHVSIYEDKLFVQGGVWSWFTVDPTSLPTTGRAPIALIFQISPDDKGTTQTVTTRIVRPDGSENDPIVGNYTIPGDYASEYLAQAFPMGMPIESLGRHVVLIETGEESETFSLPLNVVAPPA